MHCCKVGYCPSARRTARLPVLEWMLIYTAIACRMEALETYASANACACKVWPLYRYGSPTFVQQI